MRARSCLRFALLTSLVTACALNREVGTVERELPIGDATRLVLENGRGDVAIIGEADRTDVTVMMRVLSERVSTSNDAAALDDVVVEIVPERDGLRLRALLDNAPRGYHVDVTVLVPSTIAFELHDDSGDVEVDGIESLVLEDDSGDTQVADIAGDVVIVDDSGDIEVRRVGGFVSIDDGSGDLGISGAAAAEIRDGSGDITVRNVDDVEIVESGSGDVDVR